MGGQVGPYKIHFAKAFLGLLRLDIRKSGVGIAGLFFD
jgi:hypothetical protein